MSHQFPEAHGGPTHSDMTTYGAEDMEDLVSILDALDRAEGIDPREPWEPADGAWAGARAAPRRRLGDISADEVPLAPGVLVVFDDYRPVFVGVGVGKQGLRGRVQQHRATGTDLSSSTLRASVAVEVLRVSRWTARQRPSVLLQSMVDEVNEVMADFDVAWIECRTPEEAKGLKAELWSEYKPDYNIL